MAREYKKVISDKKKEAGALMTSKQFTECNIAIHTAAVAAGAGGVVPIPVMDSIPISAAQITMVIALGKVFHQKITESVAKGVLGAAASTLVGRSVVKLIPVAGWIASAAVAAGVTEAIGWSIAVDFAKMSRRLGSIDDTNSNHTDAKEDTHETMKDADTDIWDDDIVDDAINEDTVEEESEDSDDESIANDFSRAFGEEEE